LKLSFLILSLLSLSAFSSCDIFKKTPTPHFIDTDLSECREYEVVSDSPLTFRYKGYYPIDHCNGYIAVPADQVQFVREK
jgi:hypothetical protein